MQFYLGTHHANWLGLTDVPLFVSRRRMPKRKFPRATCRWALDSGGFTQLSHFGSWEGITTAQYANEVVRYQDEVGGLAFAAPMDWMCEPPIVQKTGLSVERHQELTIDNFIDLRNRLGSIVMPVVQGWTEGQYLDHVEMYAQRGVDLAAEAIVGVGTVCRRQDTLAAELILRSLSSLGLRIHAFGVKVGGLLRYHDAIVSSDSMAWSFRARYDAPIPGHAHKNCANCLEYALDWRNELVEKISGAPPSLWAA